MASHVLPERFPIGVGMAIATLVLLIGIWAVAPAVTVGLVVLLFAAACLVVVKRRPPPAHRRRRFEHRSDRRSGGPSVDEIDRLHRAELALAAAADTETATRELSKLAVIVLDAPAVVVIIDGMGEAIHMEAGDTDRHSIDDPGSRVQLLSADGKRRGSIAVAARPGRPYDERDERILEALADQMSFVLHRLGLLEDVRTERTALADVFESSSDGIFSVGPDLKIRSWNSAMERITNISADAAIGQHCCSTFRPLDEEGEPLYEATCPGRHGAPVEVMAQLPMGDRNEGVSDGPKVWLSCAFSSMSDEGYVVVARDVTARRQVEDDRADLLATVSYELRTPLTPIKRFLQTLMQRDSELDDDERRHAYAVMLREEQRLERLVEQLFEASSLGELVSEVVTERLDWARAVREQVECIQREEPDREFSVTIPDDLAPVMADDQMAAQVLANLLSNAVKFSPEGSPVDVDVEHARGRVFTTIIDEGPGIPDADRERIFDKFTRHGDHSTGAEQGVGLGLGLYIVRRSVEAMGGSVWVDDGPAGGSAFSFSLPAAPVKVKQRGVRTERS